MNLANHPLLTKAQIIEQSTIVNGTETHTDEELEATDKPLLDIIKCGTQTMTETIEDTDKDNRNRIICGTQTCTNTSREDTDSDHTRIL